MQLAGFGSIAARCAVLVVEAEAGTRVDMGAPWGRAEVVRCVLGSGKRESAAAACSSEGEEGRWPWFQLWLHCSGSRG